ncbi:MAG: gamma-glutamylcyclotransferase [Candidatus Poribacteria bacterium]|nr:gamma-glutamylcyclotransferase [Candidatus Poribacteria bacterium]
MNLFVYGTLRDQEFIQTRLNRTLDDPVEANMPGFTTVMSKSGYPVMVPAANASVEGLVWRGLTAEDFRILDRYEGCDVETPIYQREKRNVMIDGRESEVWSYFGTPAFLAQMRSE